MLKKFMIKDENGQITFLVLSSIFIASLVACNLIFQKFFILDAHYSIFFLSVGILPYPITFLVTDIISEIYGPKKANRVVLSGFFASIFASLILLVADSAQAASFSPVCQLLHEERPGHRGPRNDEIVDAEPPDDGSNPLRLYRVRRDHRGRVLPRSRRSARFRASRRFQGEKPHLPRKSGHSW